MRSRLRIDLHVHSDRSPDGLSSVRELVSAARARGLDGIAICDHDYFHSRKPQFKDFTILYGAEISTDLGHVAVFGVDSAPTKNAERLCDWVKKEGGVTIPTHPFSIHKPGLGERAFRLGTCVEKFNGTDPINNLVSLFKIRNGTGGSDAHHAGEVGLAWTDFPNAQNKEEVMEALRVGAFTPALSLNPLRLPLAFAQRMWMRLRLKRTLSPTV